MMELLNKMYILILFYIGLYYSAIYPILFYIKTFIFYIIYVK